MKGKRTIQSIRLRNLLSFGNEGVEIELQPLNVLIGPNASGKSNFVEVLRLMSNLPRDVGKPISDGGGIAEWLWKGGEPNPVAEIETLFDAPHNRPILHSLKFKGENYFVKIVEETIKVENPGDVSVEFPYTNTEGKIYWGIAQIASSADLDFPIASTQSILQQIKDPRSHPELYYLSELLPTFRLYDDFDIRRYSRLKQGQSPMAAGDFLEPDASNFGVVFLNLPRNTRHEIITKLKDVHAGAEELETKIEGGIVRVQLQEQGLYAATPPARLSGGTLRYLCLLTILLHPTPPPLICLEEPEIGLHPDVIHTVAELLVEASKRTQIIVTTHSDILVSALSEVPEAIIVCERDEAGTHLRRLDPDQWKVWLEKYTLGDLWRRGDLGGVRW
jgi:predicted ATPase